MNLIRRYRNLTHCQRLAVGCFFFIFTVFVVPAAITWANKDKATVTIVTDQDLPLAFVLTNDGGFPDGPLLLDCRISVKNGKGTFTAGSRDNMDFYGFPSSYFSRASRRVVVERVDATGKLLSRYESRLNNVIYFGHEDDASASNGERFFVLKSP